MNVAVTPALDRPAGEAKRGISNTLLDRLLGISVMAIAPAVFWTFATWLAATALGFEISTSSLAQVGAGIGLFLAVVGAAVTQRQG